jgi:hypothetical protein
MSDTVIQKSPEDNIDSIAQDIINNKGSEPYRRVSIGLFKMSEELVNKVNPEHRDQLKETLAKS